MEALSKLGVQLELPREDLATSLALLCTEEQLKSIREALFEEAKWSGLAHPKDILVKRLNRACGPSLARNFSQDVSKLVYALKSQQPVPRVILKNGNVPLRCSCKHANGRIHPHRRYHPCTRSLPCSRRCMTTPSQDLNLHASPITTPGISSTPDCNTSALLAAPPAPLTANLSSTVSSALMGEINHMKTQISTLRADVVGLQAQAQKPPVSVMTDVCYLLVHLKDRSLCNTVGKTLLESLLQCDVLTYSFIPGNPGKQTLKVKIPKLQVYKALCAVDDQSFTVCLWKPNPNNTPIVNPAGVASYGSSRRHFPTHLRITTWNCRGLDKGELYIQQLAERDSDVVVVTEHWLWPYESSRLNQIHQAYNAECTCDARLTENSTLSNGCGGVGILFKKCLDVTPITEITSDQLSGIRIRLSTPEPSDLTILGVYLPCADQGVSCYTDHLVELEQLISELGQRLGPVLIAGDFNAHLGTLGGPRGQDPPNQQGILLKQLIDRNDLHVMTLSSTSEGPPYTFWNYTTQTSVDYIIGDLEASLLANRCFTHELSPLNCSDHLPITTVLDLPVLSNPTNFPPPPKINWGKSRNSGSLESYQECVTAIVSPLIGTSGYHSHAILGPCTLRT